MQIIVQATVTAASVNQKIRRPRRFRRELSLLKIRKRMKFILPETGGTGRGILYIAGVFLLGISMILLGNKNSLFMNAYIRKGDFLYEFG